MNHNCNQCGASCGPSTIGGLCHACILAIAFKEGPEPRAAVVSLPPAGGRFGNYELLEEIGRGGMGVVYKARQLTLERIIALKILLVSPCSEVESRHRFSTEAASAAALQHPGIVTLHEIGECEGVPYLTMNFIEGCNLSQLCNGEPLPAKRAAAFVAAIANAIQHAHEHGIFHRDLKPSNILVDREDRPHITDFGIAKRLNDASDATLTGQILGSPNFLSPEQASGVNTLVGPAVDIYGMGAVLYYLLTGRAPFLAATVSDTLRLVLETDPPAPRLLNPNIPRDLETVCLKCLEKDPLRRYETATHLALDLSRFLRDEPVIARPQSKIYRLIKFIRRNRLAVSAVTFVALILVAATILSTFQAVRARRAERIAEAERAKSVIEKSHAEAERANSIVEKSRAEDLLNFMLGDLYQQLSRVGRLDVLESVGDKAMTHFGSLSLDARGVDDVALQRQAKAFTQIGEIRMAQARYAEATAAFVEANNRALALVVRHPKDGEILFVRGQSEYWVGFVHWKSGRFNEANEWMTHYYNTCVELSTLDPSQIRWQSELAFGQHNLAVLRLDRREFAKAREDFVAELILLKKMSGANASNLDLRFRTADAHSWLGTLAEQQSDFAEAEREFAVQTEQLDQLIKDNPDSVNSRFKLANSLLYETDIYFGTGNCEAAAAYLEKARKLIDALVAQDSSNRRWWATSLNTCLKEVTLLRHKGDTDTARRLLNRLRPELENLSKIEPTDRKFVLWLATAWRTEAQLRMPVDIQGSAAAAATAFALSNKLIREGRATDADLGECCAACIVSGEIAIQAGDQTTAKRHWNLALELLERRLPSCRDWRLLDPAARALALLGRSESSRHIIAQLSSFGYVPIDPWPSLDEVADSSIYISALNSQ